MILVERKNVAVDKFDQFGDEMPDGRLTTPFEGKKYRIREAILLSKRLGRQLTDDEMKQFEIE